jgi:transposase
MNKKLPEVKESVEELKELRRKETNPVLLQRIQAVYLIASGQAGRKTKIAQLLGVGRSAVGRWLKVYESQGLAELLKIKKAKGNAPSVVGKVKQELEAKLNKAEGFASYGAIREYLSEHHSVNLSYSRVHKLVRYEMRTKPKSARPSNPAKKKS